MLVQCLIYMFYFRPRRAISVLLWYLPLSILVVVSCTWINNTTKLLVTLPFASYIEICEHGDPFTLICITCWLNVEDNIIVQKILRQRVLPHISAIFRTFLKKMHVLGSIIWCYASNMNDSFPKGPFNKGTRMVNISQATTPYLKQGWSN